MFNTRIALAAGALSLGVVSAHATWYTTEATFLAAMAGPSYTEAFTGWTFGNPLNGSQLTWAAPGANGFGWTASQSQGLWSNITALSTNFSNVALTITNTGASITAFGGTLNNSDAAGNIIAGTTTLTLAGVGSQGTTGGFLGWVGNVNLTTASIISTGATNNWVDAKRIIVGNAVPEPATMAVLGLGAAALLRRRRK